MDESRDLIEWLGHDMSMNIFMRLEDPSDLVRASIVSRSWRQFVIENGLSKNLCLRMFPEASSFARVIDVKRVVEPGVTAIDDRNEWACLQREHIVYASLNRGFSTSTEENCISNALFASSTDNLPEESIKNTLLPNDKIDNRASYWSSRGAANPAAPEILIYKLASQLCLISEVHVHPFQAYFQFGLPIYSAKAVRFWMGHSRSDADIETEFENEFIDDPNCFDDNFLWTYCSPEFPMAQENSLQEFKLPEPVLCVGGMLKVELLGRAQTQEIDGLYYICVTHVQVIGRPLSPAFDVGVIDDQGKCTLKYTPENIFYLSTPELVEGEPSGRSHFQRFSQSIRTWEQMLLNSFRGAGPLMIDDYDSDYEYLD